MWAGIAAALREQPHAEGCRAVWGQALFLLLAPGRAAPLLHPRHTDPGYGTEGFLR